MAKQLTNRQWILKSRPKGRDLSDCFEEKVVDVPSLADGKVLAKTLHLSFDPAQRGWMFRDSYVPKIEIGEVVRAGGLAQVVESKHSKFNNGDVVVGLTGWQEYVVFDPNEESIFPFDKVPGHMSPLTILAITSTGLTAYFGMLDIGQIQEGETVLISGAAGATGSVACQIAKLKGCKVVGIAGGPDKCKWLTESLKLDGAIDYKNDNVAEQLKEKFPDGVDVFYDNVGGEILDTVLLNLRNNARIVCCGGVSQYNIDPKDRYGLKNSLQLVGKRAKMQGFLVLDYKARFNEAFLCLNQWADDGKLILKTDVREGFDNIPATFQGLFEGSNTGKLVLKLCDPPVPTSSSMVEKVVMKVLGYYYSWRQG